MAQEKKEKKTVDKTSRYETDENQWQSVKAVISKWLPESERKTIGDFIDGTAHKGSDTIHMAEMFPEASGLAVELDPETAGILKENIRKAGLEKRVACANMNFLDAIQTIHNKKRSAEVIYLDPPWDWKGRYNYRAQHWRLALSKKKEHPKFIEEVIGDIYRLGVCTRYVLLKVPPNFDTGEFLSHLPDICKLVDRQPIYDVGRKRVVFNLFLIRSLEASLKGETDIDLGSFGMHGDKR